MTVGTASTMKGARQPIQAARPPASNGPTNAPSALANRYSEKTLGRAAIGNQSDISELCVGRAVAWPSPEPDRMITSSQMKTATPVPNENSAKIDAPTSISRTRLRVSDSCAIGTASDRPSRAATATSDRTAALLTWNAC